MATDEDYPIDLPILVIEAQIFVAVKKFPFLPDKLIPNTHHSAGPALYLYRVSLSQSHNKAVRCKTLSQSEVTGDMHGNM